MIKAICTYCSGPKRRDAGLMPAFERYLSSRIRSLAGLAIRQNSSFFILSGKYGLIGAETPIPWYDHPLQSEETSDLADMIKRQLTALSISTVSYHTADPKIFPMVKPYLKALRTACTTTETVLSIVYISDNPD